MLRTLEGEMHRWREHFEVVLNHEEPLNLPEVEPSDELHIRTGRITLAEIKNAIKKLKNGKAPGCDNIPPAAIKAEGKCQRRFFWTSATRYGVESRYQRVDERFANQAAKERRSEPL